MHVPPEEWVASARSYWRASLFRYDIKCITSNLYTTSITICPKAFYGVVKNIMQDSIRFHYGAPVSLGSLIHRDTCNMWDFISGQYWCCPETSKWSERWVLFSCLGDWLPSPTFRAEEAVNSKDRSAPPYPRAESVHTGWGIFFGCVCTSNQPTLSSCIECWFTLCSGSKVWESCLTHPSSTVAEFSTGQQSSENSNKSNLDKDQCVCVCGCVWVCVGGYVCVGGCGSVWVSEKH